MTSPYWPKVEDIRQCIKTEAEELSDPVLMAVHEPMLLEQIPSEYTKGPLVGEQKLLEHVIKTNRVSPILGDSGYGKSHIIRWLDVNLRRGNKDGSRHIVRIPKNASLKQALMILLSDLDGPQFEEARQKVKTVGRDIKTSSVAQHLIIFLSDELEKKYHSANQKLKELRDTSEKVNDAELKALKSIKKHAKPTGLPALIKDPYFNSQLIGEGKCLYQIAKRFAKGRSGTESEAGNVQVDQSDLTIHTALGNLSLHAKTYVRNALLNTSEEARVEASDLLNGCLTEAESAAFQQLFHFDAGSFLDLFKEIRVKLKQKDKTLFVLVEDMATISAIEEVLIDSLIEEGTRAGKDLMCDVHSAIAVTTGYQGYANRRDTVWSRGQYEWVIGRSDSTPNEIYERIENFCGRYLNAARHGEENLKSTLLNSNNEDGWPGIWESQDLFEAGRSDVFGKSQSGFPLFPYSARAIHALSDRYLKPHETVEFNPRKILQKILREPLEQFRNMYTEGQFPPEGFEDVACPGSLRSEIELAVQDDPERSASLAAVWGYGSANMGQLAALLPSEIASEFSLQNLAEILGNVTPSAPGTAEPPDPGKGKEGKKIKSGRTDPEVPDDIEISRKVDEFFEKKSIPQKVANLIRQSVATAIDCALKDYGDWNSLKIWPKFRSGSRPLIEIPFNPNNPSKPILQFGSEEEFLSSAKSQKYKTFIVAIWRRDLAPSSESECWDYPGGLANYCNYKNFLDDWLPTNIEEIVDTQKSLLAETIEQCLETAAIFFPDLPKKSASEKINSLVMTASQIRESIECQTGFPEWDSLIENTLAEWEEIQETWFKLIATNRHAIEGDLLKSALRGTSTLSIPTRAQRIAQNAQKDFLNGFSALQLLDGCTSRDDFNSALNALASLLDVLMAHGQFMGMDDVMTGRKFSNRVKKLIDDDAWPKVTDGLALLKPFSPAATVKALYGLDRNAVEQLRECLTIWSQFYDRNLTRLRNENAEHGGDRRMALEDQFQNLLVQVGEVLAPDVEAET